MMGLNILITLIGSVMVVACVIAWGLAGYMVHLGSEAVFSTTSALILLAFTAVGVTGYWIARFGNRRFWKLFEDPPAAAPAPASAPAPMAVAAEVEPVPAEPVQR